MSRENKGEKRDLTISDRKVEGRESKKGDTTCCLILHICSQVANLATSSTPGENKG